MPDAAAVRSMLQGWHNFFFVFIAARMVTADVLASAAGIGISGLVNFVIQDRLTFRGRAANR